MMKLAKVAAAAAIVGATALPMQSADAFWGGGGPWGGYGWGGWGWGGWGGPWGWGGYPGYGWGGYPGYGWGGYPGYGWGGYPGYGLAYPAYTAPVVVAPTTSER
jgi:hypothetical protein